MEKKVTVAVVNHIPLLSADDADLKMSDYSITRTINGEIVKLQLTRKEQYDAYLC